MSYNLLQSLYKQKTFQLIILLWPYRQLHKSYIKVTSDLASLKSVYIKSVTDIDILIYFAYINLLTIILFNYSYCYY